jgi:hypothetical protein
MRGRVAVAVLSAVIASSGDAKSGPIETILENYAAGKSRFTQSSNARSEYFDLKIGENSCKRTEELVREAKRQVKSFLCPLPWPPCLVQGSYSVSSAIEVSFRGFGGAPVKSKTALFAEGSDLNKTESLECGRVLASSIRTDEVVDLRIEAAGGFKRLDPEKLAATLREITRLAGLAVTIARPGLGGQIMSGERQVEIGSQTKRLSEWIDDLGARSRATSELLALIADSNGSSIRQRPALRMNPQHDSVGIRFDDNSSFEITKSYFWSVTLPRWADGQGTRRFDPDYLRIGKNTLRDGVDASLLKNIGADVDALLSSVDVNFDTRLRSSDANAMARACRDMLRRLAQLLRPHDSLAVMWHFTSRIRGESSGPRCFDDAAVANLNTIGLAEPPYPGAYGEVQLAERQP